MTDQVGTMWTYDGDGARNTLAESLSLPIISDLSLAQPNDCVMLLGKLSRRAVEYVNAIKGSKHATPLLLNREATKVLALTATETERRLRREGLPARIGSLDDGGTPITATVWGFDAIEIRRLYPVKQKFNGIKYKAGSLEDSTFTQEHPLWKPVERMSARALFLLGLDFGHVELLLNDRGSVTITGISPVMSITTKQGEQRLENLISTFATHWSHEMADGAQATLGADPEFILMSPEGRIIPASRYFTPEGAAGCDSVRIRGEKHWPLVELRPRPSINPAHVMSDIRKLLYVVAERTAGDKLSWRAGALPVPGLPLGGHVHLSGVALTGERLRALDNTVALVMRLLEPPMAARRRPRYGSLGDVRRQPHGGFEYRTPPSWLVSPRLALGAFALTKVAAEHARELAVDRPFDEDSYRDAFYEGNRELLLMAMHRMVQTVTKTEGYRVYREPIDFLFNSIARARSWDESTDIRSKWRIPIK
ncbi:putative amidoligase domain-containing protein [Cohnella abietis]|uniref:PhiEco32-like amidoligase-type 2 protein n=1 Tax=Cohnella abietis TaxID=2507935 RepID=A0A3T1D6C4_9BACL|nr:hypothetical protein [Cohnella abietis]BBI33625.1 hypothetical protein KCTCHS21_30240 [Cohnella abietis]